jgi:hypothetical protein
VIIDPAKVHEVFSGDLTQVQSDVIARSQRPISTIAFGEKTGHPAWKDLPVWAAVGTQDKAAGSDLTLSMALRAEATITEIEGSHVIMISQPEAVTDVILAAVKATSPSVAVYAQKPPGPNSSSTHSSRMPVCWVRSSTVNRRRIICAR